MGKWHIFTELMTYFWTKKKYWLLPIIIVFVLLGLIAVVSESSVVGSFIYTLF